MKKSRTRLFLIFLIAILILIISLATSYARYEQKYITTNTAQIAVPIIKLLDTKAINLKINPSEKEKNYTFKVSNVDEDKKSEVSMQYTIQIKTLDNLPLEFELYKYENGQIGTTNLLTNNITQNIPMKLGSAEHEYQLKIKWQDNSNDYKYAKVVDYVQINLKSEQMD